MSEKWDGQVSLPWASAIIAMLCLFALGYMAGVTWGPKAVVTIESGKPGQILVSKPDGTPVWRAE